MILCCPNCESRFQLPAGTVLPTAGRKVRCAACATTWRAYPEPEPQPEPEAEPLFDAGGADPEPDPFADLGADADAAVAAADLGIDPFAELADLDPPAPKPRERRPAPARRAAPGRTLRIVGGWAAGGLGATLLVAGAAAGLAREQTVAFWPQTASLFAAIGLQTTTSGLAFVDIRAAAPADFTADHAELVVAGTIRNLTRAETALGPLWIGVEDAAGAELGHWVVDLAGALAPPRGPVAFTVALPAPPPGAASVSVRPAVAEDGQPTVTATTAAPDHAGDAAHSELDPHVSALGPEPLPSSPFQGEGAALPPTSRAHATAEPDPHPSP